MNPVQGRLRRYAGEGTRIRRAAIFAGLWGALLWLAWPIGEGKAWDTWQFAAVKAVLAAGISSVILALPLRRLGSLGLCPWTLEVGDKAVRALGPFGRVKAAIDLTRSYSSLLICSDDRTRVFVKLTQTSADGAAKLVFVAELGRPLTVEPDAVWNGRRLYRPKLGVDAAPMKLRANSQEVVERLIRALLENEQGDREPWRLDLPYPFREAEIYPDGLTVMTEEGTRAVYPLEGSYHLAAKARRVSGRFAGFVREWAEVTLAVMPHFGVDTLIVGFAARERLASILPPQWDERQVPVTAALEVDRTVELDELSWSRVETLVFLRGLSKLFAAGGAEELALELAAPDALIFKAG